MWIAVCHHYYGLFMHRKNLWLLWITDVLDGQLVVLWDDYKMLFCNHQNVLQNCWFVICFPFLPLWSLQNRRLTMVISRFHICLSTPNSTNLQLIFMVLLDQMRWKPNLLIVFADCKRAGNILEKKKKTYIWLHTSGLMRIATV